MINNFIDKYYFLSPMYPCTINFSSIKFQCSEALYQSYKVYSFSDKCMFGGIDGIKARHIGNSIKVRDDWNEVKYVCLYRSLYYKFEQNPELAKRLLSTGDEEIYDCNNDNELGICLMKIRKEFRDRMKIPFFI